jgi:hypothetical protein
MSLKAYTRKSKKMTIRVETNNTGGKKDYKKFYNKYNRRQTKKEIENILREVLAW